jgi:uncharacterized delta-60 repeat protein
MSVHEDRSASSKKGRDRRKVSRKQQLHSKERLLAALGSVVESLEVRRLLSLTAGSLDNTFNLSGIESTTGATDQGYAVAIDSHQNNDIVVAGSSGGELTIDVFSPSGGLITSNSQAIGLASQANAVAIDSSGNIVLAGTALDAVSTSPPSNYDFVVARYTFDGTSLSLDSSFGSGAGFVASDIGGNKADVANAVALQTSGNIVLAGQTGTGAAEHAAVVQYSDTGTVLSKLIVNSATAATGVAVDGSGNIILSAQTSTSPAVMVVNPTVTSATTYSLGLGNNAVATSIALNGNDEYLVAGTADGKFVLAEVKTNGALDTSFGSSGKVETAIGSFAQANAIALQANGKIDLAGYETDIASGYQFFAAARYDTNGAPDSAFGTGGDATTDISGNASADSFANGVAIQNDGQIVVAGGYSGAEENTVVARYVANNAPTSSNATADLDSVAEGDDSSSGTNVATLVSRFGMTDPDGDTVGLAITAIDNTYGTWQYFTSGSWSTIPTSVSNTNALLLAPSDLVRFQPSDDDTGNSSISVRAWDQTKGSENTFADIPTNSAANYNSFSDDTFTATVSVTPTSPPPVVYVNASWSAYTYGENAVDSFGQHTFGVNAFAAIQDGVNAVASGGTVEVDAGTYVANGDTVISGSAVGAAGQEIAGITIDKPVTLLGPNAGYDPTSDEALANPAAVIVPGTSDPNPYDTTAEIVVFVDSSDVTIQGLTIDGINSGLASHYSDPGTDTYGYGPANPHVGAVTANSMDAIDASEDIAGYANIGNVTIENDLVENAGFIGVDFNNGTNYSGGATTGNTITNDLIQNMSDAYGYGDGINLYDNFYASVTDNVIANAYAGVQVGNYSQVNPDGSAYASIADNQITTGNTGIFYNLSYDSATSFAVSGNVINAVSNPLYTTWFGVLAATDGANVNFASNTVDGSGAYSTTQTVGYDVWNTPGSSITGGSISGVQYGVWVNSYEGFDSPGGPSSITIDGASIAASQTGVYVEDSSVAYPSAFAGTPPTVSATIEDGTSITGGQTGVEVSGPNASLDFSGSTPASLSGQSGNYITLSNGALGDPHGLNPTVLDASQVSFGGFVGAAGTVPADLSNYYNTEDKISDYLDVPTVGYVQLNPTNVFVTQLSDTTTNGAIQRGINVATSGGRVNVQAGTFVGELDIFTSITLAGAQAGIDPNSTPPAANAQTIVEPDTGDANPFDAGAVLLVYVDANGVTINGVTVDGNNPNIAPNANTPMYGSLYVDASEGIVSYDGLSNITVENNIVENTAYTGVDFYNYDNGGTATSNNTITDNLIQNLSDAFGYGVGILMYDNFYAQVTNNVIQNVLVGVQTGNFSQANPTNSFTPEISDNQVAASGVGIFFNLMYDTTSTFTVADNQITAVNSAADAPWQGILLTSIQSNVSAIFEDNIIDGSNAYTDATHPSSGIEVWDTPTTGNLTLTGDTISGVDYGVWLNSYEAYQSPAAATSVTLDGENISASEIGVYVEDSYPTYESEFSTPGQGGSNLDGSYPEVSVSATIEGNTSITAGDSGTGILVSGPSASAVITGNDASIYGNAIGIEISGGSATIASNHIYDNGIGIAFTNGASGSVTSNNFAGSTDNGTDLFVASNSGIVTDGGGNAFAGTQYIDDLDNQAPGTATAPLTLDATGDTFGGTAAASLSLSQAYAVEDQISDYLDNSGYGYVKLNATTVYVAQDSEIAPQGTAGAIQRGINVAPSGGALNVQAGTYISNGDFPSDGFGGVFGIDIDKPLSLIGPNSTFDPNTSITPANAQAIILPGINDPDVNDPGMFVLVGISSSNVTVEGLTFDGHNESLGSYTDEGSSVPGVVTSIEGSTINAASGIGSYGDFNDINVSNNVLQHFSYDGIGLNSDGTALAGNTITKNYIYDLSDDYHYGDGIDASNNFYATIDDNVMNDVRTGVQPSNFYLGIPAGGSASISNNNITASRNGIFYNLFYQSASAFAVADNSLYGLNDANSRAWNGILITSLQDAVRATFTDNTIDGSAVTDIKPNAGVNVWNTPTTGLVEVTGGTISGATYGIFDNTYEGTDGNAASTQVTIDDVSISAQQVGVYVEASPLNPGIAVSAIVTNSTITTNTVSGICIEATGPTASVTLSNNIINTNATGIAFTNGGSGSVGSEDFSESTHNGTDLLIDSTAGDVSIGDGNAFAATGNFIDNESSEAFDLSGYTSTTFGGFNAATTTVTPSNLGTFFGIENQIVDYLDYPASGYVRIAPGYDFVTQASETDTPDAIQRGVNVANAHDIVEVQNGTFVGQVVIDTNLTLLGQSENGVVVQAPSSLPVSFTTSAPNHPVVYVEPGTTANIEQLTVDGNGEGGVDGGGSNYRIEGIAFYDAGGTVDHVTVEHVRETPLSGDQQGVAIYADDDNSSTQSLTVTNNDVFDYQKNGMTLAGAGLTVNVADNTVTGAGPTTLIAQNGIEVGFGAGGVVTDNIVSGDSYTGSQPADSSGILLYSTAAGTSVTGDSVTGCDLGIAALYTTGVVDITGDSVTGSAGAAIYAYSGDFNIRGNTLEGGVGDAGPADNTGDGIDLFDDISGTTIQNNLITDNTGNGIYVGSDITDSSAPLTVNDNSISGNATAGLDNESMIAIDATNNWWGTANGPTAANNSYNVGSQGDVVTGNNISIAPWLTNGTNNPPAPPGFYPSNNVSFAPIHNSEGDVFGSIQSAVNGSPSGDTITVGPGTFTENVVVNKDLTIIGAGDGSNPATNTVVDSASGSEAVFEITGSGTSVTVKDLYISGGSHGKSAGVQIDTGATGTVSHVAINDPAIGIEVSGTATIDGDVITGNGVGIEVESGGNATIGDSGAGDGNDISDNTTGIEFAGGSGSVTSNNFSGSTDNGTDLDIEPTAGAVTDGGGNAFAGSQYINDLELGNVIDATTDSFSGVTAGSLTLSQAYGVEDHIGDYLDNSNNGYIELNANDIYVAQSSETGPGGNPGAIQRGINIAPLDGTVNVQAGAFGGDLTIGESLTISGAQAGNDPDGTEPSAADESITTGAGINAPITIESGVNDVTIDGFAIESPNTGSGSLYAGIWMNGSTGIVIEDNVIEDNTTGISIADAGGSITHNLIQDNNVGFGVQPSAGTGIQFFASTGAWTIASNHFKNNLDNDILSDPGNGASVSNVTISNNFSLDSGGIALLSTTGTMIQDNTITDSDYDAVALIGGNDDVTINDNTITDPNGSGIDIIGDLYGAAYGPTSSAGGPDQGIISSNDTVTGGAGTVAGITLSAGGSALNPIEIEDNTLTGDGVGVATTALNYGGPTYSGNIYATLDGNTITGDGAAGIEASGLYNSFTERTTSTELTVENNIIDDDGVGVEFTTGATGSVSGNNFAENTSNGTDLLVAANSGAVTDGGGNSFAGSQFIDDLESGNLLNATADSFSGIAAGSLTLAQAYSVEDQIGDYLDNSNYGYVELNATNVYVAQDSEIAPQGTSGAIQRGIDVAPTSGTVNVQAGTYLEGATIDKSLTLSGAQAGVAAPGRPGAETIINGDTGAFGIHANNVVINGFTLEGESEDNSGPGFGYAIFMAPGDDGTQVLNNIIEGNDGGIALSNSGATQATVQQNLFEDNSSGLATDIYADQYTAGVGGVQNVLIASNSFTNSSFVEDSWAVGISNTIDGSPFNNITLDANVVTNSGRGFYFFDSSNVDIVANNVTGATHYALGLFGDVNTDTTVAQNTFDLDGDGIEIEAGIYPSYSGPVNVTGLSIHNNFIDDNTNDGIYADPTVTVTSGDIAVNVNSIAGNGNAGLENDSAVMVDASNNWWGSADGPDTPLNTFMYPTTGDIVVGSDVIVAPWLSDGTDSEPDVAGFQHADANASVTTPMISLEASSDTYGAANAPDSGIGGDSDGITSDSTPTFDGTGDDGDTINLYDGMTLLGSTTVAGGTWSITSSHLIDDPYTIYAIATDPHGNTSGDSSGVSVIIDTTAPAAPSTPVLTAASDSESPANGFDPGIGTDSDDITNINTPTFTGTAEAGTLIRLYANGVEVGYATATGAPGYPGGAGTWSITTSVLADGSYTIDATSTDVAGNPSTDSGVLDVVIDTTAPNAPSAPALTAVSDTGYSDSDGITSDNTPVFTGTAEAGTLIRLYANNVEVGYVTATGAPGNPGGAGTWSITTTLLADGTYTINATSTDTAGNTSQFSTNTTVVIDTQNPAPTINGSPAQTGSGSEGTLISLTGAANDPAPSSGIYSYDWHVVASNGQVIADGTLQNFTFTPDEFGTYNITYTVTDNAGNVGTATDSIAVGNVAPSNLSLTPTPPTINEDTSTSLAGSFTDPGSGDTHTVTINWGDGSTGTTLALGAGVLTFSGISHEYDNNISDNTPYTISVTVTDNGGLSTSNTTGVTVDYVAPTVALSGSQTDLSNSTPNVAQGSTFTLTLAPVNDPGYAGGNRVSDYFINWGDGTPIQEVSATTIPELTGGTVTHVFEVGRVAQGTTSPDDTITVDILDGNGYHSGAGSLGIVVYDVPPTAELTGANSANEGESASVVFIDATDVSPVVTTAGFTYTFGIYNVPDSTFQSGPNASASVPPADLDTPGTVIIQGTITDENGGSTVYYHSITVDNVAPTVNHIVNQTAGQDTPFTVGGSFSDPGSDAPWLVYVNYDEINHPGLGTLIQSSSSKVFTLGTTYATTGNYEVQVTVEDLDGTGPYTLSGMTTFNVQVNPTPFQVTNLSSDPSGFEVTFNRAANLSTLNLYSGGTVPAYGAADVTLVGQNTGPVTGSLIWNPSTDTADFIKTSGVLAADTYTVTLVSGSNAWEDTNDNLLAGDDVNPGVNYTTTFSIGSSGAMVSVPYFTRAEGQAINLPANSSNGIPITISNSYSNVTAVDFDLFFNSTLLNITAETLSVSLPAGWTDAVDLDNMTNELELSIYSTEGTYLPTGTTTLINLAANVPGTATYGSGTALQISNVVINGGVGGLTGVGNQAVQKVALLGDASGTERYSGFDASLIANVVVNNETGFDAYPLIDPVIIANVTGTGSLSGQDASDVAQESVHINVPQIPAIPAGITPVVGPVVGLDPTISIPQNISGTVGGSVNVPVSISDATGVQAFNLALDFNTVELVGTNTVSLGGVEGTGWTVISNSDNTNGVTYIVAYTSGSALAGGSGTIANVDYSIPYTAPVANTPVTIDPNPDNSYLNEGNPPISESNGSVLIGPATFDWTDDDHNGNWYDPGNWSSDMVPGANDVAEIDFGAPYASNGFTVYGLVVDGGTLTLGMGINTASEFTIGPSAAVDLGESALVIDYGVGSPQNTILSYINSGQLISSFVSDNSSYGIGYADGADQIADGPSSDSLLPVGQFEVEPALVGDTDLNGQVNIHDLQNVNSDFNAPGTWDEGNFEGHPKVDISDLQALLTNFNQSTALNFSSPVYALVASSVISLDTPAADLIETGGRPAASAATASPDSATPNSPGSLVNPTHAATTCALDDGGSTGVGTKNRKVIVAPNGLAPGQTLFSDAPITVPWLESPDSVLSGD